MSFKSAFTKKQPNLLQIGSEAWQKYIDAQAPRGTHYHYDGESSYYLMPNKDSTLKMKLKVRIPEDMKNIGFQNANEFSEYLYRTQRALEIEEPEFSHEDTPIEISQVLKSFNSNVESKSGKYFITPEPFRKPFEIPIKINDKDYPFEIKQVPFPSLKEVRFESSKDGIIFIKVAYNEETNRLDFSLTYNLKKANSISEICQKKELFEDLAEGSLKIFDKDFEILTKDQSSDLKHLILFYSKLYEIEQKLDIQFDPKERISPEDVTNACKVYISFVEDYYYYYEDKHSTFEITVKEELDFSSMENLAMVAYNEATIRILDQSIQMAEQFVFKCVEPSKDNKKITKRGDKVNFVVKDDRIRYNKLFMEIPEEPDLYKIQEKLKNAINMKDAEKAF